MEVDAFAPDVRPDPGLVNFHRKQDDLTPWRWNGVEQGFPRRAARRDEAAFVAIQGDNDSPPSGR